jgi:hypothetical protein
VGILDERSPELESFSRRSPIGQYPPVDALLQLSGKRGFALESYLVAFRLRLDAGQFFLGA